MSVNTYVRKPSFLLSLLGQSSGLMVLLSMFFHSAIAFLPLKEAPELPQQSVVELPPPITVTRLPERSPAAVPNSTDAQPITPPQAVEPQPASQIVIPQPVPSAVPDPAPLPVMAKPLSDMSAENAPDERMLDENWVTGDEENNPQFSQVNEAQVNEAEAAAMAAAWEGFLGGLQSGLRKSNLLQILSDFALPWQKDLFFDADDQAIVSVVTHYLIEEKTPKQVFEDIVNPGLMNQEGFEVREYGEFADGPVYEVVQGEIVHYLNILPLHTDSVLIVCDHPPGA